MTTPPDRDRIYAGLQKAARGLTPEAVHELKLAAREETDLEAEIVTAQHGPLHGGPRGMTVELPTCACSDDGLEFHRDGCPQYSDCKPYAGGDYHGHCGGCDLCLSMQRAHYNEGARAEGRTRLERVALGLEDDPYRRRGCHVDPNAATHHLPRFEGLT